MRGRGTHGVDEEGKDEDGAATIHLGEGPPDERTDAVAGDEEREGEGGELLGHFEMLHELRDDARRRRARKCRVQHEQARRHSQIPPLQVAPILRIYRRQPSGNYRKFEEQAHLGVFGIVLGEVDEMGILLFLASFIFFEYVGIEELVLGWWVCPFDDSGSVAHAIDGCAGHGGRGKGGITEERRCT